MARTLTPVDCYSIINAMMEELTGQKSTIQAVDTSSFVSAGETILSYGTENALNTLGLVLGKIMISAKPYKGKFAMIDGTNSEYADRIRKISYYSKDAVASGEFNTNLYTNLAMGYDAGTNSGNSTGDQWTQDPAIPLEMNFGGTFVWQEGVTRYENALKKAFLNESEFASFVSGYMTEKKNDIEQHKEASRRMAMLNFIAGHYDLKSNTNGSVINLTKAYNDEYGTSYTTEQLKTTYLDSFLRFFTAKFKEESDRMTERTALAHWSPAKTIGLTSYTLLRHTPKSDQRFVTLASFWRKAEAIVMPSIFNANYLNIDSQFEKVEFWQNINDEAAIDVTPAIPDLSESGFPTSEGSRVQLSNVIGVLFDKDAIMVNNQLDAVRTTPVEARKGYQNTWFSFARNIINDFTEKAVIFTMED